MTSVCAVALLGVSSSLLAAGCTSGTGNSVYSPQRESERNPLVAQRLTLEAAGVITSDPARAESLLSSALAADLYHGPAHNNLGVIHLGQGKLYEAAGEFEWARKLLPGNPDPRVNLALTLERAGRTDDAIAAYESALESTSEYIPAKQGLARAKLRAGAKSADVADLLGEISLRGETASWREWAQALLAGIER